MILREIKTLTGPWLDYAVYVSESVRNVAVSKPIFVLAAEPDTGKDWYSPSMKPEHCWHIIERVQPTLYPNRKPDQAATPMAIVSGVAADGPTYLIAFCRAYAQATLGRMLECPE